jgi:hypothetical protein
MLEANVRDNQELSGLIQQVNSKGEAIADLVGWVEVTKPNIAFIPYLNISSPIKSESSLRQRE